MKKQKSVNLGLTAILVIGIIGILFVSGCVKKSTTPTQPNATGLQTCSELGGDICDVGEECSGTGKWLDASDTFNCCSQICTLVGEGGDGEGLLDIDPFDVNPENEDLGDLT